MRTAVAVVAASLLGPLGARGEAEPTVRLADLVAEARQRNPEVQAARDRSRAAALVAPQVSAYDDPTLTYEAWNIPESLRIDRADNNIFRISQKVPFPGKRTLSGRIAERDAEITRREADGLELDVVTSVKRAYWDLWQAHEKVAIFSREKELTDRFARVASDKYAVGEISQSDVLRAQVELTRLINRVNTGKLAIDGARTDLNALLSRAPGEPLGVPETPPPPRLEQDAEPLIRLALEIRPELAAQSTAIARSETAVELATKSYLPDFEFSVGRFINANENDGFGAMASVTLPFVYRGKYDAGVSEARARLAAAEADLRRSRDRVRQQVQQAFLRARTALLQHDLFVTTHIPQAEQALHVTESGYQSGMVDFLSLIDTLRVIESVHLEHIDAQAEFERAYADLERVVGVDLPRDGTPPALAATDGTREQWVERAPP
jgi:outer membrane protein TolC